MPLARTAMYSKGVDIYISPTADDRDRWQSTLKHIATEGRCYVLGCYQYYTKEMMPADIEFQGNVTCRGGSAIIAPDGEYVVEPLYDKEGILYAELDSNEITKAKFEFDVVGHYARPDVFKLIVNEDP